MGNQILELERNEPDEIYRIVVYQAKDLASEFINLIRGPFLNSLRYGNDMFKLMDRDSYFFNYGRYVDSLLKRPATILKFAMLNDDTVLGWCLFEGKTIHYVWVKKEVRRQGIAKSLIPKDFDTITHITNKTLNIWVNKFAEVRFDPFK